MKEPFRTNLDRIRSGVDHPDCPECDAETQKQEGQEKCPNCGWTDR